MKQIMKYEVKMLEMLIDMMMKKESKYSVANYESLLKFAMHAGIALLNHKLTKEEHQQLMTYAYSGDLFSNEPYDVNQHLIDLFPVE